jgi:hypothetical protein
MKRSLIFSLILAPILALAAVPSSNERWDTNVDANSKAIANFGGLTSAADSSAAVIWHLGTTNGTKVGGSTTEKLGFYNSTPIVKPTGSLITALGNLGLVGSGTVNFSELSGSLTSAQLVAAGGIVAAGASGGQTLKGDTLTGGNLTLMSTAHATKGKILFGTSAYDEANNRLGIGTASPTVPLDVLGSAIIGRDQTNYFTLAGSSTIPQLTVNGSGSDIDFSINPKGNGQVLFGAGGWAYATAASGKAGIIFNNGSSDSPGVKFAYGTNLNFAIDAFSGVVRIIKNADESTGLQIASWDTGGNFITLGTITAGSGVIALTNSTGNLLGANLATNSVSNSALAQMATLTIKGNNTGGTANALDLTGAQVKTLLAIAQADVSGLTTGSSPSFNGLTLSTTPLAGASGGTGVSNSGKTITLGGNLTTSGSFAVTFTLSGTTSVTLPTSGTLMTLGGGTLTGEVIVSAATGPTDVASIGFRGAPQNAQNTAYTFVLTDAGKSLFHDEVTARTYTIPANASVAFPIGTTITIINNNSAGVITLAITSDTLRRGDGTAGTGSRTITADSVVTIIKTKSTEWLITGKFS